MTAPGLSLVEATDRIRAFRREDAPAVAALRRQAFRFGERVGDVASAAYIERVFFDNPWVDADLPSLVLEDAAGAVTGFLGVIPRPMIFRGRPIRAAIATQLMVAPRVRGLAGRALMRAFLNGPQDLSHSDTANESARRMWESLSGSTAWAHSLTWRRVLTPARHALSARVHGRLGGLAVLAAGPLLDFWDALAAVRDTSAAERIDSEEPATPESIVAAWRECASRHDLSPRYEQASLEWIMRAAREKKQFGALQSAVVRATDGAVVGWFIYYVARGGVATVMQVVARRREESTVLRRLFRHARRRGATAVSGRVDPAWLSALTQESCTIGHGDEPWVLMHARDPEILRAIDSGRAFLSRLEGESWLSY